MSESSQIVYCFVTMPTGFVQNAIYSMYAAKEFLNVVRSRLKLSFECVISSPPQPLH